MDCMELDREGNNGMVNARPGESLEQSIQNGTGSLLYNLFVICVKNVFLRL